MSDNQGVELLPCPFCGAEVCVRPARIQGEADCISHMPIVGGHHCGIEEFSNFAYDDDVAALWNRRVRPTPASAGVLVEAARRLLAATDARSILGRDHVPSMREEQDARQKLRQALSTTATPASDRAESEPQGTFACPICGKDVPHYHSPAEVEEHREREAWVEESWQQARSLFFSTPDRFVEGYRAGVEASAKVADVEVIAAAQNMEVSYRPAHNHGIHEGASRIATAIRALQPDAGEGA